VPKPPLPPALDEFLKQPNPSVIASLKADGGPHTAATWYLWEDGRVLVNMEASRKRLEHLRRDPRVSLTVLDKDLWYRHVTLSGRVTLVDDPELRDIDRLCRHYMGDAYSNREDRRISAWIEVESWHAWNLGQAWKGD
jgi:PPOX class probable F420-dependent enzyme